MSRECPQPKQDKAKDKDKKSSKNSVSAILQAKHLSIIEKLSEWRTYIYKQYAKLFGLDGQSESDESEKPEPMAIARGWYRIIVDLANNDVLKIDEVTEKPLKQILNFMALQKEKALEEQQRILKQQRQYDLQRNSR